MSKVSKLMAEAEHMLPAHVPHHFKVILENFLLKEARPFVCRTYLYFAILCYPVFFLQKFAFRNGGTVSSYSKNHTTHPIFNFPF